MPGASCVLRGMTRGVAAGLRRPDGLGGSLAHADLLNGPALSVALWLGALALGTAALAALSVAAWRAYHPAASAAPRAAALEVTRL